MWCRVNEQSTHDPMISPNWSRDCEVPEGRCHISISSEERDIQRAESSGSIECSMQKQSSNTSHRVRLAWIAVTGCIWHETISISYNNPDAWYSVTRRREIYMYRDVCIH